MRSPFGCFFLVALCIRLPWAQAGEQTGIPAIDSLPVHDWQVETGPLDYSKAIFYGALFPGGGQFYGKHYVRAGFLAGLEGLLLADAFGWRTAFLKQKNQQIDTFLDSALIYVDLSYNRPADQSFIVQSREQIIRARKSLDIKRQHYDLRKSEFAWALGLHFYGILDAVGVVYRSRHDSREPLSKSTAFWRGVFFPGAGQLYTHAYGKFGMLWMALGASAASAYFRQQMVDHFQMRLEHVRAEGNSPKEEAALKKDLTLYRKRRNQYFWGMALLYLYSIGDAVVDASLNDFDAPERFAVGYDGSTVSTLFRVRF